MNHKKSGKPLNITINGNEIDETQKNDIYENYIIQNNTKLQDENEKLKEEIRELTSTNNDLEEQIDKEEKSKTYMKGLMHNLYDMKNKSLQISKLRKKLFDTHNLHTKDLIKKPLKIYIVPNTTICLNIREYYILSFLIMPIFAFMTSIVNVKFFFVLLFLSIYPGTVLYYYIKTEVDRNSSEFEQLLKSYSSIENEITELNNEIDETERSCNCLDNYIDEL